MAMLPKGTATVLSFNAGVQDLIQVRNSSKDNSNFCPLSCFDSLVRLLGARFGIPSGKVSTNVGQHYLEARLGGK
eukprot:2735554-Amphidinium_carterae.1